MLFGHVRARRQPPHVHPPGLLERVQQRRLRDLDARRSGRDQTVAERKERRADHAARELASLDADQVYEEALRDAHAMLNQVRLELGERRRGRRVELRHVAGVHPRRDLFEPARLVPAPQAVSIRRFHPRRVRPQAEPAAVLRGNADRHRIVRERQNEHAVEHVVGMQPFAVDDDHVGRGGDDGLQLVRQRAALRRLRLLQLVKDQDLALQLVAPLRRQRVVVDQATVA